MLLNRWQRVKTQLFRKWTGQESKTRRHETNTVDERRAITDRPLAVRLRMLIAVVTRPGAAPSRGSCIRVCVNTMSPRTRVSSGAVRGGPEDHIVTSVAPTRAVARIICSPDVIPAVAGPIEMQKRRGKIIKYPANIIQTNNNILSSMMFLPRKKKNNLRLRYKYKMTYLDVCVYIHNLELVLARRYILLLLLLLYDVDIPNSLFFQLQCGSTGITSGVI